MSDQLTDAKEITARIIAELRQQGALMLDERRVRTEAADALERAEARIAELGAYVTAQKDAAWELFDAAQVTVKSIRHDPWGATGNKLAAAVESFAPHMNQQVVAATVHARLAAAEARIAQAERLAEGITAFITDFEDETSEEYAVAFDNVRNALAAFKESAK